MSSAQKLIAQVIAAEIDEHGYEDDDEKRWQVAYHWAAEIDKALGRLNLITYPKGRHVRWLSDVTELE
ncbi:hypothetical protein [Mycobacteroides abscessus]|uniref:hypothetical protein n=1 Tax=Mycobacteroides abscessus TaxID=36809 RepID=UPI0009A6C469|nr:hypothetical protein [Mycobacteroides abscessus]SKK34807.1 Uncharacterised protein [Mycobacteroides abscessus subsp. massiliense]SKM33662.1 Uncharacterised protein [Mycobacteroides abscessus subsp. massiliense]SKP06989.1 Uncharacterised protein [Mycobacteroides abscessus subsp. massiliense]SKP93141.1 Uncharacterised protein [Mycobacteroides abscessus subsp. massiliense]SLK60504.1 Uncharacterised protein [Mycobacteroides abscessus subsp. massiliense]